MGQCDTPQRFYTPIPILGNFMISQFDPIIIVVRQLWIDTLENPKSVFYKNYKCEHIVKLRYSNLKAVQALNLLKIIKLEAMKLLSNPKRFGIYVNQQSWAKSLGVSQQRVSQLIKYLTNLGLIQSKKLVIQSSSKKMSGKLLIFPNRKEPSETWSAIKSSTIFEHTSTIFGTNPQIKSNSYKAKNSRLLSGYYIFCNELNTSYLDSLPLVFSKPAKHVSPLHLSNSKKEEYMRHNFIKYPLRYKLKEKVPTFVKKHQLKEKACIPISKSIEKPKVSVLTESQKKDVLGIKERGMQLNRKQMFVKYKLKEKVITYGDYGLYPTNFFDHIELQKIRGKYLDKVIKYNITPKNNETQELITYWNNIQDKRFSRIQKLKGRTFNELRMVISYHMELNILSLNDIKKSIDLFVKLSTKSRHLKFSNKIKFKLLDFLTEIKNKYTNKSWFSICQLSESEAINLSHCGYTIDYTTTINDRIKPSFIKYFYPENSQMGSDTIDNSMYFVNIFTNKLVEYHKNYYFYGIKITPFTDMLFEYIAKQTENWTNKKPNTGKIFQKYQLTNFIFAQRQEPGWEKFGDKKESVEKKETDFIDENE